MGLRSNVIMDVQRCNVTMEVQRWNRNIMALLHNYDPNNYGVDFPGNAGYSIYTTRGKDPMTYVSIEERTS